jgi:hypothetical protein
LLHDHAGLDERVDGVEVLRESHCSPLQVASLLGTGNFLYVLITVLAAFYIFLGAAALGSTGVLGILGGAATIALVAAAGRLPKRLAVVLLITAVVLFAFLTWWSIVSPVLAILVIAIGTIRYVEPTFGPAVSGIAIGHGIFITSQC